MIDISENVISYKTDDVEECPRSTKITPSITSEHKTAVRFKIIELNGRVTIGLVSQKWHTFQDIAASHRKGWALRDCGFIEHAGNRRKFCEPFYTGDEVWLQTDPAKRTISVRINDTDFGVAFEDVPFESNLSAAITLLNAKVEIVQ